MIVPDVDLQPDELVSHWFYCGGEFGYEMISWAPYLRYLKERGFGPIQVVTRRGASVFFGFADRVIEVDPDPRESGWTSLRQLRAVAQEIKEREAGRLVAPANLRLNPFLGPRQMVSVGGVTWDYRNIHAPFKGSRWHALSPEHCQPPEAQSLLDGEPFILLSNKRQLQWNQTHEYPLNSFNKRDLSVLRDVAEELGYRILYNFFAKRDEENAEIFSADPRAAFVDIWGACPTLDPSLRNDLLLTLLRSATIHVTVQGGSCYVPAMMGVPQELLVRQGDYVDYVTLSQITGSSVRCHYEVETMIPYLRQLPNLHS